jgi:bifunctional non-homologous end joining protein LigD
MECLAVARVPEGEQWTYEVKLDGYRAVAVKSNGAVTLYSRNGKNFNRRFPSIVEALSRLPDQTVIDGEVVALNDSGRPDFNSLQNSQADAQRIHYFVFDLLILKGRDLTKLPLRMRREMMGRLSLHSPRIRISEQFDICADDMLSAVRQQRLEGVIAKRKDSFYEAGWRTGSWSKLRINRAHEFVIGGYIPGPHGLDSIIVGYYSDQGLWYVARVRNGFVPATRRRVCAILKLIATPQCPFANLPETGRARWGDILDAKKMVDCVWVCPELVAQIEFLEWSPGDRLRHSRFKGLREDKDAKSVVKEHGES